MMCKQYYLISHAVLTLSTYLPLEVTGQLPNTSLISRKICKVKSKYQICTINLLTIYDLKIPNDYKLLNNKTLFFLYYTNT